MVLSALAFYVWHAIHPGLVGEHDAPAIADAIDVAVSADANALGGAESEAALASVYAVRESWLRGYAVGDNGVSLGVWQQRAPCGAASIERQAKCWVALLHLGARLCPAEPGAPLCGGCNNRTARRMAAERRLDAQKLLSTIRALRSEAW